ncbi:MAG: T9SS type A sorting domain-containing protein [Sphingobacteriales bacterium]|nr:MAG: T9SS type A sorting domain-containing protein [Sphingobacteriales bacterium]
MLQNYQVLPLIKGGPCGLPEDIDDVNDNASKLLLKMWPNPYHINATIQFSTNGGHTMIQQLDALGQVVKIHTNRTYTAGIYNIDIYQDGLPSGAYFLRLQNGSLQKVISVIKAK